MSTGIRRNLLDELVLELVDYCPLSCQHCSSNSGPESKNELPVEVVIRILQQASQIGVRKISLGGGEPTSSDLFVETVRRSSDIAEMVEVFTCGVERVDSTVRPLGNGLIRELSRIRSTKVILNVLSHDWKTHDRLTGTEGSWVCMRETTKRCIGAGIRVEFNFVPMLPNVRSFPAVLELASRIGAKRVSVLRFVPQGKGAENKTALQPGIDQERTLVEAVSELSDLYGVDVRVGSPFNDIIRTKRVQCRAGWAKLVVQADGNVLPCEVFKDTTRRAWGVSVYSTPLELMRESARFEKLKESLFREGCTRCPVHTAITDQRKRHEGRNELSKSPVCIEERRS